MKLNDIKDNPGLVEGAHSRRARHRLGQGQAGGPRRQGPDGPFRRAHQGFRGRPDAAASAPAEARLHAADRSSGSTRSISGGSRARSTPASSTQAETITAEALMKAGVRHASARRREDPRLGRDQGEGRFSRSPAASKSAVAAIEKAGGSVKTLRGGGRAGRAMIAAAGLAMARAAGHMIGAFPLRGPARRERLVVDTSRPSGSVAWRAHHGVGRRTARSQYQLVGLLQGRRAQEAHLVHAGRARHLSARNLYPAARASTPTLSDRVPRAEAGRARHVQHVLGRRRAAHGGVRAEHHAVHLGLDHHPAPELGGAVAGERSRKKASRAARFSTSTPAT